jgi:hypothetical protein
MPVFDHASARIPPHLIPRVDESRYDTSLIDHPAVRLAWQMRCLRMEQAMKRGWGTESPDMGIAAFCHYSGKYLVEAWNANGGKAPDIYEFQRPKCEHSAARRGYMRPPSKFCPDCGALVPSRPNGFGFGVGF